MGDRPKQVEARKTIFLETFRLQANVSAGARAAKVHRATVYEWLKSDSDFKDAFDAAEQEAVDTLEAEAWRRATEGYDEYVVSGGKLIYDPDTDKPLLQRRHSDQLMTVLLKGRRPERYKDRQAVEHSGEVRTIQHLLSDLPTPAE